MGKKTHRKTIRQRRKRRLERLKARILARKSEASRSKGLGARS
jgi:hypothetical protein